MSFIQKFPIAALAVALQGVGGAGDIAAAERFITLASTTSTENSGLFDHLLPRFTEARSIKVRVVAVGTGAALRLGRRGDVDVVLVHARAAEDEFMAKGFGSLRRDVMYNDFVLIGPTSDPAGVKDGRNIARALNRISKVRAGFASRGDNSGTHMAELRFWRVVGSDPTGGSGKWYLETGAGMGATLNMAAGRGTYVLADRATWLAFANKVGLAIMVEGDRRMHNPYGVMLVSPSRHAHVKKVDSMAFIDWLTGPAGHAAISSFRIQGRQVFFVGN